MKITQIECLIAGSPSLNNIVYVRTHTDTGIHGVGEAYRVGPDLATPHWVAYFAEQLVGRNPLEIERAWAMMYQGARFPPGSSGMAAISGIEQSLWDIAGKARGVPVYQLLGGKLREAIEVYGHAGSVEGAQALVARGYRAFKCPPSAALLAELRKALGDEVEIGVHCHAEFTPAAAIQLGRACEPYRPMFFEDPVVPENIEALAKVAAKVSVPLATGERFATKWAFSELLARNLVDIVQPETTRLGGITELYKLAAMAEAQAVKVAPHDGSVGPVVEMANVHVLAAIPNAFYLEHMADDVPWREAVAPGSVPERDGSIAVPDAPGLGVELDEREAAAHPILETGALEYEHRTPEQMQQSFTR
jgi:galactonate dehydratase